MSRLFGGLAALLAALSGCSSGQPPAPSPPDAAPAPAARAVVPRPDAAPPPPYDARVRSLRLRQSIQVRAEPRKDAKPIGTVAQDTRVLWRRVADGPGCGRWVEIEPRGWVCDRYLEATTKSPVGVEMPKLKADALVPGTYGKVVGDKAVAYTRADDVAKKKGRALVGSNKVRLADVVTVVGKVFWRTTDGELIEKKYIQEQQPSAFAGIHLDTAGAPALPLGFARPRGKQRTPFAPRTVVPILELSPDGARARVAEKTWVPAAALQIARVSDPPPYMRDGERWIDVDLDEQVLVAYEGRKPVYATLVSTGSAKHPTPPGIWRIWIKFAETDMTGQMGDDESYSVSTVPWTMYFAKDLALHTSYWHDRFGEPRSHGCVNLSPRDARALYFWSWPDVSPGWSMAHGTDEWPGSLVRIHSKAAPDPEYQKGYGRHIAEARAAAAGETLPPLSAPDAGPPAPASQPAKASPPARPPPPDAGQKDAPSTESNDSG